MTTRSHATRAAGFLSFAIAVFTAGPALAATLTVNNGTGKCPGASYTTIQSAIDAASANDDVVVCAGTYAEQIVIPASKDGLTVRARHAAAVTIQAPATMTDPGDIVRIHGAQNVTLAGVTVAGPLPDALFCSTLPRTGVRIDGGGSATIHDDTFTDIRATDPALRGCQNGIAILVGNADEGETGTATISGDAISSYEKTGILVSNVGSTATIHRCTVTGDGPLTTIAQNGIEIADGATAEVRNNTVSGQIYTPSPEGNGIVLFFAGATSVTENQVEGADYGILTVGTPAPQIRNNTVAACTANGIDLDEDTTGTTNAVVTGNRSTNNGEDGLYVSPASTGSVIRENILTSNAAFDARDDSTGAGTAGTASTWRHDVCVSDNHGGRLCRR